MSNGATRFPKLYEAMFGKPSDKYLAFVDLWGTTAKIANYQETDDLLVIGDLAQIQNAFWSVLASIAENKPHIEVLTASDGAFLVADDPVELIKEIYSFFAYLSVYSGKFRLIPLRAAISRGLHVIMADIESLSKLDNYHYLPYLGEGFVKTTKMEKLGPKGMRVFITDSTRKAISGSDIMISPASIGQVSILKEKPEEYFEVNWLEQDIQGSNLTGTKFRVELQKTVKVWIEKGDNYQKQMGSSVMDLLEWSDSGNYKKS